MKTGAEPALTVVTYNIHKGFSALNGRLVVHEIRERLRSLSPDVVFLQEVQGAHSRHSRRHLAWPEAAQHEFLAHEGEHSAYGMNAEYRDGHHGNAIVSRYPILKSENLDISHHALECRGLLHCEMAVPGWDEPLQYTLGLAEFIDGQWYGSAAIQFWYGLYESGGNVALDNQIAVNWYYDSRWGALEGRQPATGEVVGLFVVAGNVRGVTDGSQSPVMERSNVVLVPFPDVHGAVHTW